MTAVEMITAEMEESYVLPQRTKPLAVVVATDGSENALAAYSAARLIQDRNGGSVHVLSVIETIPMYLAPTAEGMLMAPPIDSSWEDAHLTTLRDNTREFDPEGTWTTTVRVGRPADSIVDFAQEEGAGLVIVGASKHSVVGRLLGAETAMEIVRLTDISLLVASHDMRHLPQRVLIGMDLNPAALRTVPEALDAIADSPSVTCVHVRPRSEWMGSKDLDQSYDIATNDRFKLMENALGTVGLKPDLVLLRGDPVQELIDLADYSGFELIVVGVRRRLGRERAIGGRFASRILRKTPSSVLIVPGLVAELAAATPGSQG